MKKILDKISIRLISVITVFLFLMSMLPNWYLAFIARPAGDDYGYSAASHQVWLQTHSLLEVIKTGIETTKSMCMSWNGDFIARPAGDDYGYSAASHQVWLQTHSLLEVIKTGIETTKSMCMSWNGDWFSVFLFTLMPEVFVNRSFWIVPLFWSIATIFATYYFLYQLLTRWLGFKNYITVMITGVVMLISYQWVPSSGIAFYWYVGVIHYVMPHVIALILLGFLVRYIQTGVVMLISYQWVPSSGIAFYWYVGVIHYVMPHVIALILLGFLVRYIQTGEMKYMVYSALGMIAIGGSSYYAAFLVFFAYILVISCGMKKIQHWE